MRELREFWEEWVRVEVDNFGIIGSAAACFRFVMNLKRWVVRDFLLIWTGYFLRFLRIVSIALPGDYYNSYNYYLFFNRTSPIRLIRATI